MLNDADPHLKYLLLTLGILVVAAGVKNLSMGPEDAFEFGICETTVECNGFEVGNICLGVDTPEVACIDPRNATDWQLAEAECGLDAQGICNANPELTGTAWTDNPNATYQGRSCTSWAEHPEVDLLACEDTFNDITQWSDNNDGDN